eukprot:superscaffoldBa00003655_g17415
MVHGNDPLQSPAHSNGQAALPAHTYPNNQSLDPSDQDPPALAPGSTNAIIAGAGCLCFGQPAPPCVNPPAQISGRCHGVTSDPACYFCG